MIDVGSNISALRMSMGLTRAAFADALGTNQDKIKNIETGRQRADHEILAMLRQVYAVDLNHLVGAPAGEGQILPKSPQPQAEFIPIAHFTAAASAGHGSLVQDETPDTTYAYSRAFLERRGLKPDQLAVISVKGDSMVPDLYEGDKILVDCATVDPDQIIDGQIYVVTLDDMLYVKRIQHVPKRRLVLSSSNPVYQPITVESGDTDSVRIIGRVVSSSHEW